tara:strand:+ start:34163 stop:35884 length:1722 start_codon:yes stop_codon:yes gene_type:complete
MSRVDKSFNCCGNKQGDLYVTSLNFLATAFHFTLAFGQVVALSYWRIDEDYDDDKVLAQAFLFIGLGLYWFGSIWAIIKVNEKPKEKVLDVDIQERNLYPSWVAFGLGTALALAGMWSAATMLDGTFPLVYTIAPNTAEPSAPFDSSICNGVDYKDKDVFEWTQCIRDNPIKRDLTIYHITDGTKIPWVDATGAGCETRDADDTLCAADDTFNGYSSNTACVACGGGQSCARRACYIADNPNSFIQVSEAGGDPSSFIQIGITEVVWPLKSNTTANPTSYRTRTNLGIWIATDKDQLDAGDIVKFYQKGYEKGKYEIGTYMEDDKVEYSRKYYVWWLLFGFSIITAGFHMVAAISGWKEIDPITQEKYMNIPKLPMDGGWTFESGYLFELENGKTPYRWWEYSITASIMFLIVLQLNRVTDVWINITAALFSAGYNTLGAAIDNTNNWFFIAWFWQISGMMFIAQFWLLFWQFEYTIAPYLDESLATSDLWGQLFTFVRAVNLGIFITFCTFPIANIVHLLYRVGGWRWGGDTEKNQKRNCMYRIESTYIILSFTSKALLVFFVFWGVAARND